jgi:hypothetical protein
MRKFGVALLGMTLCCPTFSSDMVHTLVPTVSVEYQLKPNVGETFANIFFWTVRAACTINSESPLNPLHINMKHKSATVNSIPLAEGAVTDIIVNAGDQLMITAAAGAQVELTNQGSSVITAVCGTI